MNWKVGFKIVHPFNPDWGVGEVIAVGPQGRNINVHFPSTDEQVTLSTHEAAFQRWIFPLGARANVTQGECAGLEVVLTDRIRDEEGHDTYRTSEGNEIPEEHLSPLGPVVGPLDRLERLEVDLVDHYENRYAGAVMDYERQTHGLSGILGARVTLYPHQLHVAYQVARKHPVRALLADEVGLGKTIEAGMIYSALRQAGRAAAVLVIAPEALTVQWLGELFRKFHDVFVLMDDERLEDASQDHPELSPWQVYPRSVCSLQYLASNEILAVDAADLEGGWDLLIVDEAHHLRYEEEGGNAAYRVVEAIAANTRNILFLTATPMELDRREYFGLLRLLRPSLFHDFDLFEVQLEEIAQASEIAAELEAALGETPHIDGLDPEKNNKGTKTLRIPPDLPDRIADALTEDPRLEDLAVQAVEGDSAATRELLEALTRMHPLGDTVYSNTRARVGGFKPRHGKVVPFQLSPARRAIYEDVHNWIIDLTTRKECDPRSPEAITMFQLLRLAAGPLAGLLTELKRQKKLTRSHERAAFFDDLIARCEATITEDSARLDALLDEVRDAMASNDKLLVFVNHIADLEHLRNRIEARVGVRVATFHERLPAADRDIQVAMFKAPDGYPVLLSTEAGGEGRNFQFCHRLVHYDLPASPNRVEQRIGRLDRIGQNHEVQNLVLVSEGTVEHEIAKLLDTHIGVFEHTIGGLDPVMEVVGGRILVLCLSEASKDPSAWENLANQTNKMLHGARDAIARGLDHLLHRGGFDRRAAEKLKAAMPKELESQLEEFVIDFCEQTGITVQDKDGQGTYYLALDRYCIFDGLPGVSLGSAYLGTFGRDHALEREDYDFFSSGHPLVEGIFSFIRDTPFGTTALRRFKATGLRASIGIQFNYRIEGIAGGDVDAPIFFPQRIVPVAVDLDGTLRPDLIPLLTARYSKAYPVEMEEVQHITAHPGWANKAASVADQEAKRMWKRAVDEAMERFDGFARDARHRFEGFFEHRLDSAEAMLAFGRTAGEISVAQKEVESLQKEWQEQLDHLNFRRERLKEGSPSLDSVSLYIIEH